MQKVRRRRSGWHPAQTASSPAPLLPPDCAAACPARSHSFDCRRTATGPLHHTKFFLSLPFVLLSTITSRAPIFAHSKFCKSVPQSCNQSLLLGPSATLNAEPNFSPTLTCAISPFPISLFLLDRTPTFFFSGFYLYLRQSTASSEYRAQDFHCV